jgi:hemolysin III
MTLPADHYRITKRELSLNEVLADGIVHALALLAGVIAFPILLFHALQTAGAGTFAALAVYATGFFLMWGFSLAYNMTPPSALKWLLRRFDHSAIFIMIAGTYMALLVHFDSVAWAWALALTVWIGAAGGIAMKMARPGRHDGLAVVFYVLLGAVGLVGAAPAMASLPGLTVVLILLGGIVYVAGIGFYKWTALQFHNAIWHGFVLLAAGLHFAAIAVAVQG